VIGVAQHGASGGTSVAEKLVEFAYDLTGTLSSVTRYADLLGTELVATAAYDFDLAGRITELTYIQGATTLAGYTWYDAWNRLVELSDTATQETVAHCAYDGRNFRTVKAVYTAGTLQETRHAYYSAQWQLLEERVDASTAADRQFVWGLR
jgi:hypothetical protein